ncbi:MAG: hypothetical protein HC936_15245 [Leptolyngbyaceae cyanobacterium SU_3_3]|nr:hypothetical protein [Leptolyngbyaceae cyanobacterium SU_3_3]
MKTTISTSTMILASTAPALRFSDGSVFSATPLRPALLSVNVPLGVQWGQPSPQRSSIAGG